MDPCGTTLEVERLTAEKAQVVGLCCELWKRLWRSIRVASQHAEEETQEHANDERPTDKMVFEEPLRSFSMNQRTMKDEVLTTVGELYTRHRPRSVANHRETAGDQESKHVTSMRNEPKGSRDERTPLR